MVYLMFILKIKNIKTNKNYNNEESNKNRSGPKHSYDH